MKSSSSLQIGGESVKANAVPTLILQCAAVGLVMAYYLLPSFRGLTEPIADWHREYGWRAAFVSQAFFCGVLPGLFLLAFRSIRPRHPFLTILAQTLWCGTFGICCNELFRRMVLPNLLPNWVVWIPVSLVVFSFPFPLQIHVNGLICTFWTLMCLQIGRRT